jgi:hypothetical protein
MKTFSEINCLFVILLLSAGASRLAAQTPEEPTETGPGGTGLIPAQLNDPNQPGADTVSPPGAPSAFLQIQQPPALDTESVSPFGAQSLIQLRPGELGPWTAAQVTGAPNTLTMGDYSTAWAAANADANEEWLRVQFTLEADLDRVRVVQSFNPGAITKIAAERSDGQSVVLEEVKPAPGGEIHASPEAVAKHARHRKQAGHPDTPGTPPVVAEFAPPAGTSLRTTSVRITIDERKVPGWNEIDAVEIVSRNGARQWAQAAQASSSFGDRVASTPSGAGASPGSRQFDAQLQHLEKRVHSAVPPMRVRTGAENKGLPWSPEQATGAPDTPVAGDYPTAWAPLAYGGREWLDVTFARPADVRELRVVESSQTRAISAVQVYVNGALVPLIVRKVEPGQTTGAGDGVPQVPESITNPGDGSGPVPATNGAAIPQPAPHTVSASPESASLPAVQKVRIDLDSTGLTTWPEIDAVELVGTDGSRQWAARAEASSTYASRYGLPAGIKSSGYERAYSLEEANQRIDLLTRRLEKLERELERTKAIAPPSAPPPGSEAPPSTPGSGRPPR